LITWSLTGKELHFLKVVNLFDLFRLDDHIEVRRLVSLLGLAEDPDYIVFGTNTINTQEKGEESEGTNVQKEGKWHSNKANPEAKDRVLPCKNVEQCSKEIETRLCYFQEGLYDDPNAIDKGTPMGEFVSEDDKRMIKMVSYFKDGGKQR